jgi:hypothetical protein
MQVNTTFQEVFQLLSSNGHIFCKPVSRWGRDFPYLSRPTLGPTQPAVQWVIWSFPGIESGRGVTLTPNPFLLPRSKKQSRAITLLSLMAFMACTKGETYLLKLNISKLLESGPIYVYQNFKIIDIFNLFFVIRKVIFEDLQYHAEFCWVSFPPGGKKLS